MTRERATAILQRILSTIEAGKVSVRIRGVWVFGSYARGALEPGDLDLIIIHEPMPADLKARLEAEARRKQVRWPDELYYPQRQYASMVKSPLRRPGEAVDMVLGTSLEEVLSHHSMIGSGPCMLLWSEEQRGWEHSLAEIKPDAAAARAERHEFMPAKVAGCSMEDMGRLTALIDGQAVVVERVEPPEWPVQLSPEFQSWADRLIKCDTMGRKSLECLPLGLWWLRREGCKTPYIGTNAIHDESSTLQVTFGRLHPRQVVWFLERPGANLAAHVLHFNRASPRGLLAFQRGAAWDQRDAIEERMMRQDSQ